MRLILGSFRSDFTDKIELRVDIQMSGNNTDTGDTTAIMSSTSLQKDFEAGEDQLPRESLVRRSLM